MKGKKVLNATIVDKYNMCKVFSYLDIKICKLQVVYRSYIFLYKSIFVHRQSKMYLITYVYECIFSYLLKKSFILCIIYEIFVHNSPGHSSIEVKYIMLPNNKRHFERLKLLSPKTPVAHAHVTKSLSWYSNSCSTLWRS